MKGFLYLLAFAAIVAYGVYQFTKQDEEAEPPAEQRDEQVAEEDAAAAPRSMAGQVIQQARETADKTTANSSIDGIIPPEAASAPTGSPAAVSATTANRPAATPASPSATSATTEAPLPAAPSAQPAPAPAPPPPPQGPDELLLAPEPLTTDTVLRGRAVPLSVVASPGWTRADGEAEVSLALEGRIEARIYGDRTEGENRAFASTAVKERRAWLGTVALADQSIVEIDGRPWGRFVLRNAVQGEPSMFLFTHASRKGQYALEFTGDFADLIAAQNRINELALNFRFPPDLYGE